jgi:hypothetical protein
MLIAAPIPRPAPVTTATWFASGVEFWFTISPSPRKLDCIFPRNAKKM